MSGSTAILERRSALSTSLRNREVALERSIGEIRALVGQGKDLALQADSAHRTSEVFEKAALLIRQYADARQGDVHAKIESLVSEGLTQIFQEDLRLQVNAKAVGKRTDVEFRISTKIGGADVVTSVMDARGGGVAAVAGFLLRVVILLLTPGTRKILFLDESFAQVSAEYEPRLADFISELADKFGIQFVMVTHSTAFDDVSDAVFRTTYIDGTTQLEKVS